MLHHDPNYIASVQAERLRKARGLHRRSDLCDLEHVVSAARVGDPVAWSALVARFRGIVLRAARAYGLKPHEADDVAQETWLRLYRRLETVRDPHALGAWLDTTARRESVRALQSHRREDPTDQEIGVMDLAPDDADEDLLRERRAELERELATLPERHRRLMQALLAEDAPCYATIAADLDIPIGSIGPIRGRCIERLRRTMAPESI